MASSALSPPSDGDQNRGWQLLAVHSIFLGISTILLFARFYTRIFIIGSVGFDDLSIALGVLSSIGSMVLDVFQVRWGWGRHTYYLLQTPHSRARLLEASKLSSMNQINTIIGIFFIKLSIGLLLLRVFGVKKFWRWAIYSIVAFVFVTTVISFSMVLAQCRPLAKLWNTTLPGTCWKADVVIDIGYYNGAVAVASDWALSTVPIVILWDLQMDTKRKAGIAALMGVGYFTGVAAIIRTVGLKDLDVKDITWVIIPEDNWAGVEFHLGIIAACVPTIRPLFDPSSHLRFRGWSKLFSGDSTQPQTPAQDKEPLRRVPFQNRNSLSYALRSGDGSSKATNHGYGNAAASWTTAGDDRSKSPVNAINVETEFALDDLEFQRTGDYGSGRKDMFEERKITDRV